MNQSAYRNSFDVPNKRNIIQLYVGLKTYIYNYNSICYPNIHSFNNSPININYYQFKLD